MSRRSRVACAAAALAASWLIGAAPATAQSGGGVPTTACAPPPPSSIAGFLDLFSTGINGVVPRVLSSTDIPANLCGSLVVAFHGDPAGNCARLDLCGVSGQAIWTPAGQADITLITYRARGRTATEGDLAAFSALASNAGVTTEVTRIAPDGTAHECVDDSANPPVLSISALPGRRLRIGGSGALPAAGLTGSRCAGPLAADIASALPSATLPAAALQRPGTAVDLSGVRAFSGPGLRGTVSSTLTVVTGRAATKPRVPSNAAAAPAPRNQPAYAEAKLAIEPVSGSVTADIAGPVNPAACAVLDACGLTETLSVAPRGTGVLELLVRLPAGTGSPRARLLRAAAGAAVGIGAGQLGAGGVVQATAVRGEGSPTCTDAAPIAGLQVLVAVTHGRAEFSTGASGESDPFRTRCPGPELSDFGAPFVGLAAGGVRLSSLLGRTTTLVLGHALSAVSADGYRLRGSSQLRWRVRLQGVTVVKAPVPVNAPA